MQLQIFKYEENDNHLGDITTVEIDGEVWFVASDVCALLGIKNVSDAVKRLDDDEKLLSELPIAGQNRRVLVVSESGLYSLIFRSSKPIAKTFRRWVTKDVIPSIRKTGQYGINRAEIPNFVRRFNDNWNRTDRGYFSVISELFVRLYGRFEQVGYQIPNKAFDGKEMRPDGSVGRLFSIYLKKHHPEIAGNFKMYSHRFPNGFEVDARQYPNEMLPIFIKFVDEEWIMKSSVKYFRERDATALDYLPKLLKD